jgi:hypothetical protein
MPEGEYKDRKPYPFAVAIIRLLKEAGHTIIFNTSRYMKRCEGNHEKAYALGYAELYSWLKQNEVPFDELYLGKPSGDFFFDDLGREVNSEIPETWENVIKELDDLPINTYNEIRQLIKGV